MAEHYALDPWVFLGNTLDFNHLKVVHRLRFEQDDPDADIDWQPHAVRYRLKGTRLDTGDRTDYRLGIVGTSVFWLTGTLNGRPMHFMMPFRSLGPRSSSADGGRPDISPSAAIQSPTFTMPSTLVEAGLPLNRGTATLIEHRQPEDRIACMPTTFTC